MMLLACVLGLATSSARGAEASRILVLGDSLSAGYGMAAAEGWVALLDRRLQTERPGWQVVNASVSGETTSGGASRIDAELQRHRPAVVLVELGGNDGLRGLPLELIEQNLDRIVRAAQASGARVGVLGIRVPPNYGSAYGDGFQAIFSGLAERHRVPLLPFLLEPIAAERDAFQPDNIHPTADVQARLLDHVWPVVVQLVDASVATGVEAGAAVGAD